MTTAAAAPPWAGAASCLPRSAATSAGCSTSPSAAAGGGGGSTGVRDPRISRRRASAGRPGERQPVRDLGQPGRGAVAVGDDRLQVGGPLDPHLRVVVGELALGRGVVVARALVDDVRLLAEHAEPVGEADRDEELVSVLVVEAVGLPLAEGGRATAQVDRDVEDCAPRAAQELGLARMGLEMHAAQRAAPGARVVVLHELHVDAHLRPGVRAKRLQEEAPRIAVDLRGQQDEALEPGVEALHRAGRLPGRARPPEGTRRGKSNQRRAMKRAAAPAPAPSGPAGHQTLSVYIADRFDEFSRSQKDVAQYIVDHLDEAAFQTAEALARRANTSSSTVVRFSQALGFEGFPELQQAARDEYRRRTAGNGNGSASTAPLFSLDQNEFETALAADHVNMEETARQ